jgi:hypothetical protein
MNYRTKQKQLKILKKRRENPEYREKCKIHNLAWYERNKESSKGEIEKLRNIEFLIDIIKKIQQDFNDRFNEQ